MQTLSNILDYKHAQWLLRSIDSILSSSFLCDSGFWIYDPCSFPRFCLYAFIACIEHAYEFFPWNRKLPCIPWDLSHNTGWLHQNLFIKTSLIVEFCKTKTSETVDRERTIKNSCCVKARHFNHSDRALQLLLTAASQRPCLGVATHGCNTATVSCPPRVKATMHFNVPLQSTVRTKPLGVKGVRRYQKSSY